MKKLIWIFLGLTFHSNCQTPGNGLFDNTGSHYDTVIIGAQEWQKTNHRDKLYADGTEIPYEPDPTVWSSLTRGAWCFYNENPGNEQSYGVLYNWYAVMGIYDAASLNDPLLRKQFAPDGWHVPTQYDFNQLLVYLDPNSTSPTIRANSQIAGDMLKEVGTLYWNLSLIHI